MLHKAPVLLSSSKTIKISKMTLDKSIGPINLSITYFEMLEYSRKGPRKMFAHRKVYIFRVFEKGPEKNVLVFECSKDDNHIVQGSNRIKC